MLLKITLILGFLVTVNFILLYFSCNKTTTRPVVRKTKKVPVIISRRIEDEEGLELAPTGS